MNELFERRVVETKKEKLDKLGKQMAYKVAKEMNDPDYRKLKKHLAIVKTIKERIIKKYGSKGKVAALKAASKH